MTRSTTSMKRQSPSGQWLTVWESIAGRCASTSMHPNVRNPSHEADGRASSTPTATTSWPVGRKAATTRQSCTERSSGKVIQAQEPSSRTLSPRCGVVRQQNVSSAACAWDPGGFADGSPAHQRRLAKTNATSSTRSWRRHRLPREAYSLLQEFRRILTERRADALRSWLERAARASLAPLRGFARSLEQDMDAVMNALTYPWSNGRVEGCINKLKLLKRQMYGRAGIELLRRRFLAMGR